MNARVTFDKFKHILAHQSCEKPDAILLYANVDGDAGLLLWCPNDQSPAGLLFVDTLKKIMATNFKTGDHVSWNSEAGRVSGTIIKIHHSNFNYKGYTHHATKDDPQYEIKSDKTDHIAAHKGSALTKLNKKS